MSKTDVHSLTEVYIRVKLYHNYVSTEVTCVGIKVSSILEIYKNLNLRIFTVKDVEISSFEVY